MSSTLGSNNMKTQVIRLIITVIGLAFVTANAHVSKEDKESETRVIHLTKYKSGKIAVETTDKNVTVWTKENPYKAKDSDIINAEVILSPKIAKGSGAVLVLHTILGGKKEYIGDIIMEAHDHTYEDTKETVKMFSFSITKKYFDQAVVRIWTDSGKDYGEFELHLHTKK